MVRVETGSPLMVSGSTSDHGGGMSSNRDAHRWFIAAAVVGVAHALPSLYWALGGTALVSTVGAWAADWQRQAPMQVMVLLLLIFVLKLAVDGAVNVVAALAALTGVVAAGPTMDTAALMGHAFLWDPLFLLWGLLLGMALRRSGGQLTWSGYRRGIARSPRIRH